MTRHLCLGVSLGLLLSAISCACILGSARHANAMEPPAPGMVQQMQAAGDWAQAQQFAEKLGNHRPKPALRGKALPELAPADLASQIMQHLGQSLDAKGAKAVSAANARELDWVELDLNHDRVVDERDILALGYQQPKEAAVFPSLGTSNTFCLLLDFDDYPHYFDQSEIYNNLFGAGTDAFYFKSLKYFYDQASYGQLNVGGEAYGWYRASHPRIYYHADDSAEDPDSWNRQAELVEEAILAYDAMGEDFSQYDNDGDGQVDYFLCVWAGPHGNWASFWWGYFGVGLPGDFVVDGVTFPAYSWQWERYFGFGQTPPEPEHWDPYVTIHETGHALGLPDYYDYDGGQGPDGGLGGLDQMDGNWGDHNSFSKFILGWFAPTIAFTNLPDEPLAASYLTGDAVITMPGFDPVTPWSEYFITQNRLRGGIDQTYPADGTLIWHVDARVDNYGGFRWNNSYSDHKLLKLMEADGLNEIESGGGANAGDYWQTGTEFSPTSNPNSHKYDDSDSHITINDFSANGDPSTADFTLYTSNPPSVNIVAPAAGATVSGTVPVHVTSSDDIGVDHVQILIDGLLVNTNTNSTADFTYSWNSLVDYNKTLTITARAWDDEGQAGSMSINVTVSNSGVTEISDDFESGLGQWRSINEAMVARGQVTRWTTRNSPADPPPLGSGREAWVRPNSNNQWCGCHDLLRAMRLDTSGFTRDTQLRMAYRCRGSAALMLTSDEGATWTRLDTIPEANSWTTFNRTYTLPSGACYLRFDYNGDTHSSDNSGWSLNLDDLVLKELPSDPPTIEITSHESGDRVQGNVTFTAEATDDVGVSKVYWYLNGSLAATDEDGAPWEYTRNTLDDDNHPNIWLSAAAEDTDGLPSGEDAVWLIWRNERPYPVEDDLESGDSNWGYQPDALQPQWAYANIPSHSGMFCQSFVPAEGTSWEAGNYDGLWYNGYLPATGLQCIDLSDPSVYKPELTFWLKDLQPGDGAMSVYFYSTWVGWQDLGWFTDSTPEWTELTIDMAGYTGQSGRVVFWIWGGEQTDGTGIWLDDIRLGNRKPYLESLNPSAAQPGKILTLGGRKFGAARDASTVTFAGGMTPPDANYVAWSDTEIQVRIPTGIEYGPVYVTVEGQPSNSMNLGINVLSVDLAGLAKSLVYSGHNMPQLTVQTNYDTQRVELYVDGVLKNASTTAPFGELQLPVLRIKNGAHAASLTAYRGIEVAQSPQRSFTVYSLRGDVDADGSVGFSDVAAVDALIGMTSADPGFWPWFDPDGDGIVTEADVSYLGYHFGESIIPW